MDHPGIRPEAEGLLRRAREASQSAYCPYSNYAVGAAVDSDAGVFAACNVENASYSLTICAERAALFAAVAAGARQIFALAVSARKDAAAEQDTPPVPCGACRQVMTEFMGPDAPVYVDGSAATTMNNLLPCAFRISDRPVA